MRLHLDNNAAVTRDEAAAKNFKDGYDAGRIQGMQDQQERQQRIRAAEAAARPRGATEPVFDALVGGRPERPEYRGEPSGPTMDVKTATEGPGRGNPAQRAVYGGTVSGGGIRSILAALTADRPTNSRQAVQEILTTSEHAADFYATTEKHLREQAAQARRAKELIDRHPEVAELIDLLRKITS